MCRACGFMILSTGRAGINRQPEAACAAPVQGAKVALVGANGQGKSTLVRLMLGELTPGAGLVQRHSQARIGVFAQDNVEALVVGRGGSSALAYAKELHPEGAPDLARLRLARHQHVAQRSSDCAL